VESIIKVYSYLFFFYDYNYYILKINLITIYNLKHNFIINTGRGTTSHAYIHSLHDDHHVFINLHTLKVSLIFMKLNKNFF